MTSKPNYHGTLGEDLSGNEGWGNVLAAVFLMGIGFAAGMVITAYICYQLWH